MIVNNSIKTSKAARLIEKLTQSPEKNYPLVDKIVLVYIAVTLLFQIFFQISPVMTFLATTPLYDMQTYLGLLGGVLILVDIFTTKKIWRGKYCLLLYAILLLAALASIRMISYGMKENIFKLCWATIQYALIYSCVYRLSRDSLKKYLKSLLCVFLVIWGIACCISIYQYAHQIGYMYVVNPLAKDSSANRQGFFGNRLFGIFYTLNHAAFISVIFFLASLIWAFVTKKVISRILLLMADVVLLTHIILSGSRNAMLALLFCMFFLAWIVVRNRISKKGTSKLLVPALCAVLFACCCIGVYQVGKTCLSYIPYMIEKANNEEQDSQLDPEDFKELLDRPELEGDTSNGRLSIWKDYATLYREIGPIGMSPGNYMGYILENHPEMYIVEYIRQYYPDKYDSGIIYHVHSGYLMIFVSAGWIGAACLLAFMILCLIRFFRNIYSKPVLSYWFIIVSMIVAAVAISAFFDEGVFFQNNPQTTVFWLCLGILMKECSLSNGEKSLANASAEL